MKTKYLYFILLIIFPYWAFSQEGMSARKAQTLPLWPNGAKEDNGIKVRETVDNQFRISNISEGMITVQLPVQKETLDAAVIICPGGGYVVEAASHEGYQFADWLNEMGVAAIVLKYRLPNGHPDIPLADAKQAIRIVRAHAQEWHIDPNKIAVAGFSAGGHLASTLGTHFDNGDPSATDTLERYSSRPDMMILFYPVITMDNELANAGSRLNLFGKNPTKQQISFYSNELQVKENTPPTIMFLCDDDKSVKPANSILFYEALKEKKIPASLCIFPEGGHGWGMRNNITFGKEWRALLHNWFVKYQFSR